MENERKIIVSACLAGDYCRYDGETNTNPKVVELYRQGRVIKVCPEILGGLPQLRAPAELTKRRAVKNSKGRYVTKKFKRGAEIALRYALAAESRLAIFKAGSPSCGVGKIYDGTFTHTLKDGDGVTTELFKANGIEVITEEDPRLLEI